MTAPPILISGLQAESFALQALHLAKNTAVWRPSPEQVASSGFRAIVGTPHYTATGLVRGTVLDSVTGEFAEIKSGLSLLDSTYQLRLQTYRSLVERRRLTFYTNRPVESAFRRWLEPLGVAIKPLPPLPEP